MADAGAGNEYVEDLLWAQDAAEAQAAGTHLAEALNVAPAEEAAVEAAGSD